MPSGAPTDASYVLITGNAALTQYRLLQAGNGLDFTDGGALGNLTVTVDESELDHALLGDLSANSHPQYILGSVLTANGDVLTRIAGSPAPFAKGSDGQYLGYDSSGLALITPPAPSPYLAQLPHQSGVYYTFPTRQFTPGTNNHVANFLRCAPFFVPTTTTYDRAALEITANAAGNNRIGVWGPITGSYASLPLLLDTGNINTGTTGVKTATISLQLAPGWYLLGHVNSNTNTFRAIPAGAMNTIGDTTPFGAAQVNNYFFLSFTYGTLPNPLTGLGFAGSGDLIPWLQLRAQ